MAFCRGLAHGDAARLGVVVRYRLQIGRIGVDERHRVALLGLRAESCKKAGPRPR